MPPPRQMVAYYDNPSNDARKTPAHKWARHYRKEFETEGNWLREIALAAQEVARGRRVLELACGHCRWTPFIAEVDFAWEAERVALEPKGRNLRLFKEKFARDELRGR